VIAFMGIGLVDPILKPIADDLSATPSQVSPLFTSYNGVMAVAMLTARGIVGALGAFMVLLLVMGLFTENKAVLVVCTVPAGAALGVNNTLITETVMKISPVERSVASSA
jgi:predicted MFS family arabinose efflux permease